MSSHIAEGAPQAGGERGDCGDEPGRGTRMKNVYKPRSGTELALIKSLLVSEDLPFNVVNDGFGSLEVGPQIGLFNERIIQVPAEHAARAEEVIRDFLAATADVAPTENFSFFDKVIDVAKSSLRKWLSHPRR